MSRKAKQIDRASAAHVQAAVWCATGSLLASPLAWIVGWRGLAALLFIVAAVLAGRLKRWAG